MLKQANETWKDEFPNKIFNKSLRIKIKTVRQITIINSRKSN